MYCSSECIRSSLSLEYLSVIHDHCSFLLQPLFMMGIVERGYLILVHLTDYNMMSYTDWMWWTHGVHVGTNLDDRPFIEPSTAITTACHSIKWLCLCWHRCINRRVNLYPIIMQSNHIDWTAVFAVLPIMALQQFLTTNFNTAHREEASCKRLQSTRDSSHVVPNTRVTRYFLGSKNTRELKKVCCSKRGQINCPK